MKTKSKYVGVRRINRKCIANIYIGVFPNEIDAARAYNEVAKKIGKKRLNKIIEK